MIINNKKYKLVNRLIQEEGFLSLLCSYSNNDYNTLIDNLVKIINYCLTCENLPDIKDFRTLISLANDFKGQGEYTIYPTNSAFLGTFRRKGLKPDSPSFPIPEDFAELRRSLSYQSSGFTRETKTYHDLKEAILTSFDSPRSIYREILKQPANSEQPIYLGQDEKTYYSIIASKRLENIDESYRRTGTTVSNKILRDVIGSDVLLIFLPQDTSKEELDRNISPFALNYIQLPSKYKLISMCALNKGMHHGDLVSYIDGSKYQEPPKEPQREYSSLRFLNYEPIVVDDSFVYTNEELSGDINYDIDLMYGSLDKKGTREGISKFTGENIRKIKNKFDISVSCLDGKYTIHNGRHRIVYLKHYYCQNQIDNPVLKKAMQKEVTVPAQVTRTIEDPIVNHYLIMISSLLPKVMLIKTDITNQNPGIIYLYQGKAFLTRTVEELKDFYEALSNKRDLNRFYLGKNNGNDHKLYQHLINELIIRHRENIFKMNLLDIINEIRMCRFVVRGIEIDPKDLNYYSLSVWYNSYMHNYEVARIKNVPPTAIEQAIEMKTKYEIGDKIVNFINAHPEYYDYNWSELVPIIYKAYPELCGYEESTLKSCANLCGYYDKEYRGFFQTNRKK